MNKNNDNIINLQKEKIRTAVLRAKKLRTINPLLDLEDTGKVVKILPPHELYSIVKRVGLEDSLEILEVATTEQIQKCIDFDIWSKDKLVPNSLMKWFAALSEISPEKLGQVVNDMEIEEPGLLLYYLADVYEIHEDAEEEPPEDDRPFFVTPDGWYELRPKNPEDEETWRFTIEWIQNLYAYSMALAQKIILESKWDTPLNMEEEAYKWRNIRINEEGFWDYYEAIGIYQYLDPRKIKIVNKKLPVVFADDIKNSIVSMPENLGQGPFAAGFTSLDLKQQNRVKFGVVALMNRLMAADMIDISDDNALENLKERAISTLNLGVEFLAQHSSLSHDKVIAALKVETIFKAGYSLTLELKRTALAMREIGLISLSPNTNTLLEEPWLSFYESIIQQHPMMHQVLFGGKGIKPFSSLKDLANGAAALEDLGLMRSLIFQGLGFDASVLTKSSVTGLNRKAPSEISYGDILRTIFVGFVITGEIITQPLTQKEFQEYNIKNKEKLNDYAELFINAVKTYLKERNFEVPQRLRRMILSFLPKLITIKPELYILFYK